MNDKPEAAGETRLGRRRLILGTGAAAALFGGGYLLGEWDPSGPGDWEDLGGRPLRLYSGRDDTANFQRRLLIDQWNAMHPDHPAEMVELPAIADLHYSTVHSLLQAEDSTVDVVNLDVPWIAEFAGQGYLHELDGVDGAGFIERPFDAGVVDGDVYALPFNSDVGMLYYRKEAVTDERAEGLGDWAALRELMDEILSGGDFEAGIAMQLKSYEGFTVNVWEYLLANGVETDPVGAIDFGANSRAVELLEDLAWHIHPGLGADPPDFPYIHPASLQYDEAGSLTAFQERRTPFLRHWPRVFGELQSCEPGSEVGVVPMPGGVLGGQSLAVAEFCERKTVAQALIEFLTDPASQQLLFERGGFASTRPGPYFDAIARVENIEARNDGAIPPEQLCGETGDDAPRVEAEQLHAALDSAGRRPGVERYTRFSRAFQDFLHDRLQDDAAPNLDGLAETLEAAIEGR